MTLAAELDRPLLLLACRHHIYERHIIHCWNIYLSSKINGPDNPLFKKLKDEWNSIDQNSIVLNKVKIEDISDSWLQVQFKEALSFSQNIIRMKTMKTDGCRSDYLELVELTTMVLSGDEQFRLRKLGPVHHARFMAKGIYFLKMYLLLNNISSLTDFEKKVIKDMAFFTAVFYTEWFIKAEIPAVAPYQDMKALWQMMRYSKINPVQAKPVIESLKRHTWYIDPNFLVMSLVDKNVQERSDIAKKLYSTPRPTTYAIEKHQVNLNILNSLMFNDDTPPSLTPLITDQSWLIFHILNHANAEVQWLKTPSETWDLNDYYLEFKQFVNNLEVVNDCSERAIKLVQELINKSHNEDKRQSTFLVSNKYKSERTIKKKCDYVKNSLFTK
ncbi:uncharacterized protein LOC124809606 [Hydra vulgaris]|uniref:uncharacterized protein LOC124809606 n=1 Tax=Hydra vulgaris TaxID=6087 RepID=UPI0032EA6A76